MIKIFCQDRSACYQCSNFYVVGNEIRTAFSADRWALLGRYDSEAKAYRVVLQMVATLDSEVFWMPEL